MTNLLSAGIKLFPNLVTRVEENLRQTFGKLDLTIFSVNTAACGVFSRGHHSKGAAQSRLASEVVRTVPSRARRRY